jgi:hypothetical protein
MSVDSLVRDSGHQICLPDFLVGSAVRRAIARHKPFAPERALFFVLYFASNAKESTADALHKICKVYILG